MAEHEANREREIDFSELTFEQALAQLEEIVDELESGKLGLDLALARYELGVKLVRHCRQILQHAERRVRLLIQQEDGEFRLEDFEPGAEGSVFEEDEEPASSKPRTRGRRTRSGGDDRRSLIGGEE